MQPDVAATARAYDPDYGTDAYWQEEAPKLLARGLIVEQLRQDIVSGELTGALGTQR